MPDKIHILSREIADLIAAGEVVERPYSVVKELVENSIDAKATSIIIEIAQGGVKSIRVTDNGTGMSRNDAMLSFVKHATSKISSKDDLFSISSLGFRGEALASISAVSRFEILTKTKDSAAASKIILKTGADPVAEDAAAPDGTSVTVKDLFYNTPARLKFLKSEQTETGLIVSLIERLALSRPDISFQLFINGRENIFTSGNGKLSDVIYSLFGKEFSDMMLEVDYDDGVSIKGYTGKPLYSRPNRNHQVFFVNGRLVRSRLLQMTLEAAYKNSMLISRYPACVLFIGVNPSQIDINIHPSKQEIKFSDETAIKTAMSGALNATLRNDTGILQIFGSDHPEVFEDKKLSVEKVYKNDSPSYPDWEIISGKENTSDIVQVIADSSDKPSEYLPVSDIPSFSKSYADDNNSEDDREHTLKDIYEQGKIDNKPVWKFIGEVFSAYIIIQKDEDVLFIDKHALHERINFERLKTMTPQTQTLLTPITVSFDGEEYAKILENSKTLETLGFEIEDFGPGTVIVRKIPQLLSVSDVEYLLNKFASDVCSAKSTYDEFLYDIACKASIKSGMNTSEFELKKLVEEYFEKETELKYCPHGRPVCFSMSKTTLEKQFKRII